MPDKRNRVARIFLLVGLLVQIVTYLISPDNLLYLCSGCLGICSVVLCSQGKISTFFFGFAQIATYTYVCWMQHLYSAIALNVFYFFSQIYGIYIWHHRMATAKEQASTNSVPTRRLPLKIAVVLLLCVLLISAVIGYLLARYTNDTHPYLDAFSTVPAIAAQILMILAYREQWIGWLMIDVLSVVLWIVAGNWCMVAQYVFWCANCLYGYYRWSKSLAPR